MERDRRSSGPRRGPGSSAVIALPLLARELLGHRLGRKLRDPSILPPDPRECSSLRLEPAHARALTPRNKRSGSGGTFEGSFEGPTTLFSRNYGVHRGTYR
jgi:hypothetical protein